MIETAWLAKIQAETALLRQRLETEWKRVAAMPAAERKTSFTVFHQFSNTNDALKLAEGSIIVLEDLLTRA